MKRLNRTIIVFVVLLMAGAASLTTLEQGSSLEIMSNPTNWLIVISAFFLVIAFMATFEALDAMKRMVRGQQGSEASEVEEEESDWVDGLLHKLTDATPVENEEEVATDHEYDGIRELDNNLPPWWLAGFYISIAFAIIYLMRFHVLGTAPLSQEELKIELAEAEAAKEEYLKTAANLVDESNVEALSDESRLLAGADIFMKNCAVCHANDGGGGVGPNLTDPYWIHGNDIKDVFKTVKYGVPAKGMIPWQDQLSASEMQEVASYILTLQGTTPADPKEPQGDLVEEKVEAPAEDSAVDSTTTEVVEEAAASL
jgi:cytochrome c oxidase cbb3-type subunit 3